MSCPLKLHYASLRTKLILSATGYISSMPSHPLKNLNMASKCCFQLACCCKSGINAALCKPIWSLIVTIIWEGRVGKKSTSSVLLKEDLLLV